MYMYSIMLCYVYLCIDPCGAALVFDRHTHPKLSRRPVFARAFPGARAVGQPSLVAATRVGSTRCGGWKGHSGVARTTGRDHAQEDQEHAVSLPFILYSTVYYN